MLKEKRCQFNLPEKNELTPLFWTPLFCAGEELQLVVPSHGRACDFLVTSAADDWMFLIGRWRPTHDGESYGVVVIVARRRDDGVYATELWHETHRSFVMRASTGATV